MITAKTPRFELIGKTKATITDIDPQTFKLGQNGSKPAVAFTLRASSPNEKILPMFGERYLAFMYENTGKNTGALEGIQVVSGLPNLTPEGVAIGGSLKLDYEQSGCTVIIYNGNSKLTLKSCVISKVSHDCKEGGTVDTEWRVFTADSVDEDVIGTLGVLKSQDRDIEQTLPEIISQQQTLQDDDDDDTNTVTPIKALTKADKKARSGAVA